MTEFDSPWKEALDRFLPLFLRFFFPDAHREIDWERGYEALDKELAQIVREAESGGRLADKLFRVWRTNGDEAWVLIHVEIQAQVEAVADFTERIYAYNYRIYDRFQRPVASMVVLGDDQPNWRPEEFRYALWGTELRLKFRTVKLLDYQNRQEELERHDNPFALVVLAHLQSLTTKDNPEARRAGKVRLVKNLLGSGMSAENIRQMFRVIDWLLELPRELTQSFWQEIQQFEKEKQMPVFTSTEQYLIDKGREVGRDEGRQQGRQEGRKEGKKEGIREGKREAILEMIADGLKRKFGDDGAALAPSVEKTKSLNKLRELQAALWTVQSIEEIRELLGVRTGRKP
jgi:hypothetical protein